MMEHYLINNSRQIIRKKNQYTINKCNANKYKKYKVFIIVIIITILNLNKYISNCSLNELLFVANVLGDTYKYRIAVISSVQ